MKPHYARCAATPCLLAILISAATLAPSSTGAQVVEPRSPVEDVQLGGRVHLQFSTSSADGVPPSEFFLRRARVWVGGRVNGWIDGVAQVDFGKGEVSARYAFLRLSLSPALRISLGQFKRAFDLFELTSSSRILVVERDGGIRGAGDCTGIGGVCSYSRFSEQLELSSLDIGVLAYGDLKDGWASYSLSFTNGTGGNAREENGAKSFSGRFEVRPAAKLRLGGNLAVHDFVNPATGEDGYAPAGALDLEWGDFDGGPHLQAGVMLGENWRNLDRSGAGSTFTALQGILTYRYPLAGKRIRGVEPVVRVSWGDPDRGNDGDSGVLLTPGLTFHFEGRNKIAANVDVWRPATGPTRWSLKVQSYLYF